MVVSAREVQACYLHISKDVKQNEERLHHDWIEPAQFPSLHFISEPLHFKRDINLRIEQYSKNFKVTSTFYKGFFG